MKSGALLFFLSMAIAASAQTFEGRLVYANVYKSKLFSVEDSQWNNTLGTKLEYLIRGGDYKSTVNGVLLQWQLYKNKENRLYTKLANAETVYWNDAAENKDSVLSYAVNKNALAVLGNACDEVVLTCKSGVQKYYFNAKYKVDPSLFANHNFGNWYAYLRLAKALPLKQIIENEQFILESTVVEIAPETLDANQFELPPGAKVEKYPY